MPLHQKIKNRIYLLCEICKAGVFTYPCRKNKRFCSRLCLNEFNRRNPVRYWLGKGQQMLGENHPKWIKDRTKLVRKQERNDMAYKEWRQQVWLRDNWKCRIASTDCKGRIEAHHILGWISHPELRYVVKNGITLCHAHHPFKKAEEKRLSPYFQELLSVSND